MLRRLGQFLAIIAAGAVVLVTTAAGSASASAYPVIVPHVTNASSTGPLVVGIGDSILEGHGLDPDQAWLAVLAKQHGWKLINLASDGSGFVTVGNNEDTFADQVKAALGLHPKVIVISGSSNDLGENDSAIATATEATINTLHRRLPATKIIAVSAVWGDTAVPPQLHTITADVAADVRSVGGSYLDIGQPLSGHPSLMQSDDVHPTVDGQRVLAAAVAKQLHSAHLTL